MIGFRVDANEKIASGHVMRCLSIADALVSFHEKVVFIISDISAEEMIAERGHECVCLRNDWNNKEGELEVLIGLIRKYHLTLLLIDSYQVTEFYLRSLHSVVKLAYIDDLNTFDYPVDMVINYSVYADREKYPSNSTSVPKKYLLGPKYAPLRQQFILSESELQKAIQERERVKQIFITTGASDPYHVAELAVRSILEEPSLREYRIIVVKGRYGDSFSHYANERVVVHENVANMAELMLKSTMAVSAGGSTLYELCACCVPTVVFTYADNQLENANTFSKKGIMKYSGDAREEKALGKNVVRQLLEYSTSDHTMLYSKMKELDCGNGAKRLAEELL